jgi:hypothetical protein
MSNANELKEDFQNILTKWGEALDQPESDLSRDAAILRFELAYGMPLAQNPVSSRCRTE